MNLVLFLCLSMVLHLDIGYTLLKSTSAWTSSHDTPARSYGAGATESAPNAKDNPTSNRGVFEMPTLGRPVVLGELYSTHSDLFIPSFSLWDQSTIKKNTEITWIPSERVEFESGETRDKAYEHFDLTASLKVSYDAGMVVVSGSAAFLDTKQTDDENAHVRLSYKSRTRAESISTDITANAAPRCHDKNGLSITTNKPYDPTHVVAQIVYGGNAHFDFMKEVHDSRMIQHIQGELDIAINLELTTIHGHAEFHYDKNRNKTNEDIQIKLFTDFLVPNQPTTVNETIALYKNVSHYFGNRADGFNGSVPISISLIPIEKYCPSDKGLAKEISEAIFEDAVSNYRQLKTTLTKIEKLLATHAATYNLPIRALLLDFKEKVNSASLSYGESLAKIIPVVRSDPTNTTTLDKLHDLIHTYTNSCFDYDTILFEYLTTRTREVNAINIFYTQTINKAAPQISQFREAEIAEALITKKSVFILTLFVVPNTTDQLFDINYPKCGNDRDKDHNAWFNNRTTTGNVGYPWRQFLAFYTANYNLTTVGKKSAFFVDIVAAALSKTPAILGLYLNGKNTGPFKVPEILKKTPIVCRGVKRQLTLFVDNPQDYNTEYSKITHITVNYTLAYPNPEAATSYKVSTTVIASEVTKSKTTRIVIENINSEQSYNFTVSFVTEYGAGPASKVFTTYGPLGDLRRTPRCTLEVDFKYTSLIKQKGNFSTVSECAAEALSLAKTSTMAPTTTVATTTTTTKGNQTTLAPTPPPPSGAFWWSYDLATRNCYTIDLKSKVVVKQAVGWVSGSPACGVNPTTVSAGSWGAWGAWSACPGKTWSQTRSRGCASSPLCCKGSDQESRSCNTFSLPGEHLLVKNTLITTLPSLAKEYTVSFEFKATSYITTGYYHSILHLSIGGKDGKTYGGRTPFILVHPKDDGLSVCSAVNGDANYYVHIGSPSVGKWMRMTVSQKKNANGIYHYTIETDGKVQHTVVNSDAQEFTNVSVYASDPTYAAQPGSIRNLVIKTALDTTTPAALATTSPAQLAAVSADPAGTCACGLKGQCQVIGNKCASGHAPSCYGKPPNCGCHCQRTG